MSVLTNCGSISRNVSNLVRRLLPGAFRNVERHDAYAPEKPNPLSPENELRPLASSPCSMHELDADFVQIDDESIREKTALQLD